MISVMTGPTGRAMARPISQPLRNTSIIPHLLMTGIPDIPQSKSFTAEAAKIAKSRQGSSEQRGRWAEIFRSAPSGFCAPAL